MDNFKYKQQYEDEALQDPGFNSPQKSITLPPSIFNKPYKNIIAKHRSVEKQSLSKYDLKLTRCSLLIFSRAIHHPGRYFLET